MTKPLRVGLMVPINNTTMARELTAWLPAGTECVTLRIPRGKGMLTSQTIPAYRAQALSLAEEFAGHGIDILAYGCTAAGFISGPAADSELAHALGEVTGRPVVTTARAMVEALEAAGVNDIAVVTPYLDAVNTQLKAFLADGGIRVRAFDSLYAPDVDALGRITGPEVAALSRRTMRPGCEALFIACSQLPTYEILGGLAQEFGRPVLSSIQSTAWQVRRALGIGQ